LEAIAGVAEEELSQETEVAMRQELESVERKRSELPHMQATVDVDFTDDNIGKILQDCVDPHDPWIKSVAKLKQKREGSSPVTSFDYPDQPARVEEWLQTQRRESKRMPVLPHYASSDEPEIETTTDSREAAAESAQAQLDAYLSNPPPHHTVSPPPSGWGGNNGWSVAGVFRKVLGRETEQISFEDIDENRDGVIDRNEFDRFVEESNRRGDEEIAEESKSETRHSIASPCDDESAAEIMYDADEGWDVHRLRAELNKRHVTRGQLFSLMDIDRSDTITWREFQRGIAMSGLRPIPPDQILEGLFKSLDSHQNGHISYRELFDGLAPPKRAESPRILACHKEGKKKEKEKDEVPKGFAYVSKMKEKPKKALSQSAGHSRARVDRSKERDSRMGSSVGVQYPRRSSLLGSSLNHSLGHKTEEWLSAKRSELREPKSKQSKSKTWASSTLRGVFDYWGASGPGEKTKRKGSISVGNFMAMIRAARVILSFHPILILSSFMLTLFHFLTGYFRSNQL